MSRPIERIAVLIVVLQAPQVLPPVERRKDAKRISSDRGDDARFHHLG